MVWNDETISKLKTDLAWFLPANLVVARHTDKAHFYEVDLKVEAVVREHRGVKPYQLFSSDTPNPVYSSVTGKLQILKDESLINYKMNLAIRVMSDYLFANHKEFTEANIMEHVAAACAAAERAPGDILEAAGGVGTTVHDTRHLYFKDWIREGRRPEKPLLDYYVPEMGMEKDIRVISCLRALDRFITENDYTPLACELLVYDHKLAVSGTLDDLGLMKKVVHASRDTTCDHKSPTLFSTDGSVSDFMEDFFLNEKKGTHNCVRCGYTWKYQFVLMDLKTSNAFKDHYFFQVALYYYMVRQLTGYRPERCFILKVSKEDGRYKIEDLYQPATLASYARSMVRTHDGVTNIKSLRSDNQKVVVKL